MKSKLYSNLRKKTLFFFLLFGSFAAQSQIVKSSSDDIPGLVSVINPAGNRTLTFNGDKFLYIGGNIKNNNATLTMLDKQCKTLWSTSEFDNYISASIFNNNILVVSAINTKARFSQKLKELHITLLDKDNGKVLSEKSIPSYSDKTVSAIFTLTDTAGNFKSIAVRTTNREKLIFFGSFSTEKDYSNTNYLQVFTLNNNLDVQQKNIDVQGLQNAQFISCASNNNGDLFFAYLIDNNVVSVKKYSALNFNEVSTVNANVSFDNDVKLFDGNFLIVQNNVAWLTFKIDEKKKKASTFITGKFNFNNNKGVALQELENKDFLKQYDAKKTLLFVTGASFYKSDFITIKEGLNIEETNDKSVYYSFGPVVITIFDSNMHILKDFVVEEKAKVAYNISTSGFKILDNKLYIFYNYNNWKLRMLTRYQTINLDDFSQSDKTELDFDLGLASVLYAPSVVWFNHTALMPITSNAGILTSKMKTNFKTVEFK